MPIQRPPQPPPSFQLSQTLHPPQPANYTPAKVYLALLVSVLFSLETLFYKPGFVYCNIHFVVCFVALSKIKIFFVHCVGYGCQTKSKSTSRGWGKGATWCSSTLREPLCGGVPEIICDGARCFEKVCVEEIMHYLKPWLCFLMCVFPIHLFQCSRLWQKKKTCLWPQYQ